MKPENKRFLTGLLAVTAATAGLTFLVGQPMPQYVTPLWWAILLFFVCVSVLMYFTTMKVRAKNDLHKFTNFYMATTVIKLVLYLLIISVYYVKFAADAKAFVVTFLMYYLCFSVFETIVLVKKNK